MRLAGMRNISSRYPERLQPSRLFGRSAIADIDCEDILLDLPNISRPLNLEMAFTLGQLFALSRRPGL